MGSLLAYLNGLIEHARRANAAKELAMLTTIKSEIVFLHGHEPSWDDAATYAKSHIKAYKTAEKQAEERGQVFTADPDELSFLESLLPAQLSDVDIREYFAKLVKENPKINKGGLMKSIKQNFPNQYDGKVAATIAGEF